MLGVYYTMSTSINIATMSTIGDLITTLMTKTLSQLLADKKDAPFFFS